MTITALPTPTLVSGAGGLFVSSDSASLSVDLSIAQTATDVTVTPSSGSGVTIPAATTDLAGMLDAARAAAIDGLPGSYNDLTDLPDRSAIITMIFDGGGAPIIAPFTRYLYIPFAATITGWALMADQTGSIAVDVWKESISGFPPTVVNSITGGSPPSLSSQASAVSSSVAAWATTQINAGDCLAYRVLSATTVQVVTFELTVVH
jgi:hypothetical protein